MCDRAPTSSLSVSIRPFIVENLQCSHKKHFKIKVSILSLNLPFIFFKRQENEAYSLWILRKGKRIRKIKFKRHIYTENFKHYWKRILRYKKDFVFIQLYQNMCNTQGDQVTFLSPSFLVSLSHRFKKKNETVKNLWALNQ